jgi:hypothetical protein
MTAIPVMVSHTDQRGAVVRRSVNRARARDDAEADDGRAIGLDDFMGRVFTCWFLICRIQTDATDCLFVLSVLSP